MLICGSCTGTVIRVSPNELSFSSVASWKDIYGFKSEAQGKETHIKSDFYQMYASGYQKLCIGSEPDPKKHSVMKKDLSEAFSTRALLAQERIIHDSVDEFLVKIDSIPEVAEKGLDLTKWFGMFSFDLFGEMALGESFGAVEAGEPHFWPKTVTQHLFFVTILDNLRHFPWISRVFKKLLPWATTAVRDRHTRYTREHLDRSGNISCGKALKIY